MKIDPRLLQAFVAVARVGDRVRARRASASFLTQPAVSLQLEELVALVELELFQRTPTGLLLDAATAAPLDHTGTCARRASTISRSPPSAAEGRRARRAAHRHHPRSRVHAPERPAQGAGRAAPELETELHHGTSGEVLARLLNKEVDVGFYLGDPEAERPAAGPSRPRAARGHALPLRQVLTRFAYQVIGPPAGRRRSWARDGSTSPACPGCWRRRPPSHSRLLASRCCRSSGCRRRRPGRPGDSRCSRWCAPACGISLQARDARGLARPASSDEARDRQRVRHRASDLRFVAPRGPAGPEVDARCRVSGPGGAPDHAPQARGSAVSSLVLRNEARRGPRPPALGLSASISAASKCRAAQRRGARSPRRHGSARRWVRRFGATKPPRVADRTDQRDAGAMPGPAARSDRRA